MIYRNDVPFVPRGLELDQAWFCGGRVGASLARHGGLTSIVYYGRQPLGRAGFFKGDPVAAWTKVFRLCVIVDDIPYHPDFRQTELHPFGYRSEGSAGGVSFAHELVLLNDALVQRVRILANPRRAKIALRLVWHGGPSRVEMDHRTWTTFTEISKGNLCAACAVDDLPAAKPTPRAKRHVAQQESFGTEVVRRGETHIAVGSDARLAFRTMHGGFKHHADCTPARGRAAFIVAFAGTHAGLLKRMTSLRASVHTSCDAKFAAAASRERRQPSIKTGSPALESFLAQVPDVVDALRVEDVPGAMRASAGHYWVWGWDSMVYSKGLMLAGRGEFVRQMLEFYRSRSHPKLGIPHAFGPDTKPSLAMAFTAQCLYMVMLYNHYCISRDAAILREYFPFARWVVEQAMKREVRGTGLVEGPSLFPDFPDLLGHDGHDLSVLNNGIYYQALRCTADLQRVLARTEGRAPRVPPLEGVDAAAERCRAGFRRVFWDDGAGYFFDSASSRDMSPRRHHPAYAVLWVTPHAADLVAADLPRVAAFMAANLVSPRGVYNIPPADQAAFLSDGNQAQAYYPVVEPFYRNVMSRAGRGRELEAWSDNVKWFWDRFTIPEGLTFDAVNASQITPDCPGGKQPFAGKAWYEIFFTAYAGVDVNVDGVALRPTPVTSPVEIRNLRVAGRRIDIRISGRGLAALAVKLNGKTVEDPGRIPVEALKKGVNRLEVRRAARLRSGRRSSLG